MINLRFAIRFLAAVALALLGTLGIAVVVGLNLRQAAAHLGDHRLQLFVSPKTAIAEGAQLRAADLAFHLRRTARTPVMPAPADLAGLFATRALPAGEHPLTRSDVAATPPLAAQLRGVIVLSELPGTWTAGLKEGIWIGIATANGPILTSDGILEAIRVVSLVPSKDGAKTTLHLALGCTQYRLIGTLVEGKWHPMVVNKPALDQLAAQRAGAARQLTQR